MAFTTGTVRVWGLNRAKMRANHILTRVFLCLTGISVSISRATFRAAWSYRHKPPSNVERISSATAGWTSDHGDMPRESRQADPGHEGDDANAQDGEGAEDVMFSCRVDNAKAITTILSCLSHGTRKGQQAQCEVTGEAMTLVVSGKAKYTQAQAVLESSLFQDYYCGEGAKFGINLTTLLECLQIFGPGSLAQTSVCMAYEEARALFRLTLEEAGVFTSCEIRTIHQDEEAMEFSALAKAFSASSEVCRCILKSDFLKEAFQELADLNGATSVAVTFGQEAPHLQLSAKGALGSSEIDFPKTSEAFVCFECSASRVSWTFLMSGMETGMRALPHANETYFRVNGEGILCIQHQIPMSMGQMSFVDVLLCPDVQESDMGVLLVDSTGEGEEGGGLDPSRDR